MGKNIKFGDIEIQKQRFHLYKEAILMENIHINKRSLFVKKDLNISLATKMLKKLGLYVYFYQKLVHIEKSFIELNICVFCYKMMNY